MQDWNITDRSARLENAGQENDGQHNTGWKMQDWKLTDTSAAGKHVEHVLLTFKTPE